MERRLQFGENSPELTGLHWHHIHEDDRGAIPPELRGRVINWRWDSIANFIERVDGKRSFYGNLLS
jgi:hypothetical protein